MCPKLTNRAIQLVTPCSHSVPAPQIRNPLRLPSPKMRRNRELGTLGSNTRYLAWLWENEMQTAVERVMRAYGLMVSLTEAEDQEARERLEAFLSDKTGSDHELAVQGLQFLRGSSRSLKRRTICRINSAAKQVPC
jgi:hypothetical protein